MKQTRHNLSQAAFGRLIGVTRQRVAALIARGLPTMKDGTVPQERGLRWVKNNVVARSAESDGTNYVQARAERVLLQIEILKMDLEKKRGTYVTVSDVQMVWAQMASACRTRLLSLPAKLR